MTLLLTVPAHARSPLAWAADFAFTECLGIEIGVLAGPPDRIVLSGQGRALSMPSIFPAEAGGLAAGLPRPPLGEFRTDSLAKHGKLKLPVSVPVLFGTPAAEMRHDRIDIGFDLLGTIFFMLSRYEELNSERDRHDRYPGRASLACRAGFLDRPIVDECVEILGAMVSRLWPGRVAARRRGEVVVSCDVDHPFDPAASRSDRLARAVLGDLVKRRHVGLAVRRLRNVYASRGGDYRHDPNHVFDWYLDTCERHGRRVAFFFIPERTAGDQDGSYELFDHRVLELIARLADRGHEIGMHGSYRSFREPSRLARERSRLREACRLAGVDDSVPGNRQHYLRWDVRETPDHLDAAGFDYDTTGGFADMPGFRHGTSRPFRMWSWRTNAPLRLVQRPLVVMECAVLDTARRRPAVSDALERMLHLKAAALRYGGDFTLLWHNSHFVEHGDRDMFTALME
jgi:hypothetical protein